jgi:hypothetical protein
VLIRVPTVEFASYTLRPHGTGYVYVTLKSIEQTLMAFVALPFCWLLDITHSPEQVLSGLPARFGDYRAGDAAGALWGHVTGDLQFIWRRPVRHRRASADVIVFCWWRRAH